MMLRSHLEIILEFVFAPSAFTFAGRIRKKLMYDQRKILGTWCSERTHMSIHSKPRFSMRQCAE